MADVFIASFTVVITRGGIYQPTITFTDADGVVIPVLSAEFIGEPNGASAFTWNTGNNLFVEASPGVWRFNLDEAATTALTWDAGHYHVSVVDTSGFTIPCIISGLMFAKDC